MAERYTREISDRVRNIPLKILRNNLPDVKARRKEDLARELFQRDPEKLLRLATYYTVTKERSFYLLRPKDSSNKLSETSLIKNKQTRDTEQDFIVNCADVVIDTQKKEQYVRLRIHSSTRRYKGEDPETLEPKEIALRKGFNVFIIIHSKDQLIECKTKNSYKLEYARIALGKLIANDSDAFEKVVIPSDKQLTLDHDIRFKKAIISNLNFAGTKEITMKGEDVAHTLEVLKSPPYNFDLTKFGNVALLKGELSNKPVKFSPDGKISAKKEVDNPYELVRGLV